MTPISKTRKPIAAYIVILLCANLGFFVWAQGLLTPFGFGKPDPSEPQRLGRQIFPERVTINPPLAPVSALGSGPSQ